MSQSKEEGLPDVTALLLVRQTCGYFFLGSGAGVPLVLVCLGFLTFFLPFEPITASHFVCYPRPAFEINGAYYFLMPSL
jgi:hypothetical protein